LCNDGGRANKNNRWCWAAGYIRSLHARLVGPGCSTKALVRVQGPGPHRGLTVEVSVGRGRRGALASYGKAKRICNFAYPLRCVRLALPSEDFSSALSTPANPGGERGTLSLISKSPWGCGQPCILVVEPCRQVMHEIGCRSSRQPIVNSGMTCYSLAGIGHTPQ
jgi:hypothetical protein